MELHCQCLGFIIQQTGSAPPQTIEMIEAMFQSRTTIMINMEQVFTRPEQFL